MRNEAIELYDRRKLRRNDSAACPPLCVAACRAKYQEEETPRRKQFSLHVWAVVVLVATTSIFPLSPPSVVSAWKLFQMLQLN